MSQSTEAQDLIAELNMQPHPEGGFFAEVYRANNTVESPINNAQRASLTHIYFLLLEGQVSRFHQVAHDEVWNYYCGAPLNLYHIQNSKPLIETESCDIQTITIGEAPNYTHIIPSYQWQAAETLGEFTLVGCSVAPGFDFEDFDFMRKDEHAWLEKHKKDWMRFI